MLMAGQFGLGVGSWPSLGVPLNYIFCECILCVDGRSRYLYIWLGGYLRILGVPSV